MSQSNLSSAASTGQASRMERYYRFHAKIYDATRWSFLFGREELIRRVARHGQPQRILEIGCGTGKNLIALARHFPQAELTGLDASQTMLAVARKNLAQTPAHLLHTVYEQPLQPDHPFDLILFSYSLTMMNPGWRPAIQSAYDDLAPGGWIAAVDFHRSPSGLFTRWMGTNHVRMEGHLLPELGRLFQLKTEIARPAYGGVWHYFMFVGEK